jgi:hypothetical protein
MTKASTISALNNLLATLHRSLPSYLNYSSPWEHEGNERAVATLADIVLDQQALARRTADVIMARGYAPRWGEYPMEYTGLHDLSLDYLVKEVIRAQQADIARIESFVDRVDDDREARELVQEALGASRAHLEALQDLLAAPAA